MKTPNQTARSILGITEDVIVKKEDIDNLVQWVRDNQGKNQKETSNPDWLVWEGRWLAHKAWPNRHFEVACSGYGNPDYYQIISLDSFKVRHDTELELLKFLASGATYDDVALKEAAVVSQALKDVSAKFDKAIENTKLPQILKNVYASKFLEGSSSGWLA